MKRYGLLKLNSWKANPTLDGIEIEAVTKVELTQDLGAPAIVHITTIYVVDEVQFEGIAEVEAKP